MRCIRLYRGTCTHCCVALSQNHDNLPDSWWITPLYSDMSHNDCGLPHAPRRGPMSMAWSWDRCVIQPGSSSVAHHLADAWARQVVPSWAVTVIRCALGVGGVGVVSVPRCPVVWMTVGVVMFTPAPAPPQADVPLGLSCGCRRVRLHGAPPHQLPGACSVSVNWFMG